MSYGFEAEICLWGHVAQERRCAANGKNGFKLTRLCASCEPGVDAVLAAAATSVVRDEMSI